jgi:outer membrane protein assembly factor BamB
MQCVAIVPIFTSAGAALLPTLIAGAMSVVAILFRPREFWRLMKSRPLATGIVTCVVVLTVLTTTWVLGAPASTLSSKVRNDSARSVHYDWPKIAEAILAREQLGTTPPPQKPVPTPASLATALVLGRDYTRCCFDGGAAPTGLKRLWSFQPEDSLFLSNPVVAGKRLYTAACQSDLGGYTGLLACLDTETGKPLWQKTELNGEPLKPFFSSPALTADGKYLVVGQGLHADKDCSLLCFEAATGQLHWAVKTMQHIESSPAICGDIAYVGAGAIEGPDGKPVGDPGFLLAVRISDGTELWRQPINDPESAPACADDGTVFIGSGFNGNAVVSVRAGTNAQLREKNQERIAWRTTLPVPVTCPITCTGKIVLAGAGNSDIVHSNPDAQGVVAALDQQTGAIKWQTSFADAVLGAVACREDKAICPCRTGEVYALALDDGHVLWRTRISGTAPVLAGCAFTGQRVYAVSNDGYLAVVNAGDGKILEKIYLNSQAKPGIGLTLSAPQVVDGRVYVGSETGGLLCFVGTAAE